MSTQKANLLMVFVTICFSVAYLFTKVAVQELNPFLLNAYRFLLAFLVTAIIFWKYIRKTNMQTILASGVLGLLLATICIMFSYALRITDASVAGFLIATTVVIVPMLMVFITRKLPSRQVLIGASVTLVGLALFSLKGTMTISVGIILCLISALLYAVQIILNKFFTKKLDIFQLGIYQLFFVGLFSLIGALAVEPLKLPETGKIWGAILILAIVCSAFAIVAQTIAQKYTSPTATGFIFSLEPIFTALFAFLFLSERLSMQQWIGALFIFIGVLVANYTSSKVKEAM